MLAGLPISAHQAKYSIMVSPRQDGFPVYPSERLEYIDVLRWALTIGTTSMAPEDLAGCEFGRNWLSLASPIHLDRRVRSLMLGLPGLLNKNLDWNTAVYTSYSINKTAPGWIARPGLLTPNRIAWCVVEQNGGLEGPPMQSSQQWQGGRVGRSGRLLISPVQRPGQRVVGEPGDRVCLVRDVARRGSYVSASVDTIVPLVL